MAWSLFCLATDRRMRIAMNVDDYFAIADSDRSYDEKLVAYEALADQHFDSERFNEFRATELNGLDEAMWELARTPEFDAMLVEAVKSTFPPHEHDQYVAHFRGLLDFWVKSESTRGS